MFSSAIKTAALSDCPSVYPMANCRKSVPVSKRDTLQKEFP